MDYLDLNGLELFNSSAYGVTVLRLQARRAEYLSGAKLSDVQNTIFKIVFYFENTK